MMNLVPIGIVHSTYKKPIKPYDMDFISGVEAKIEVFNEYAKGLEGLKPGQKIDVVFFLDKTEGYVLNGIHPMGLKENPTTGVFNTRSPNRPNPLGISNVIIEEINGNTIHVRGLDALDGTPLIDIKPVPGHHH